MQIAGLISLLIGVLLLYWQRKRKYERSNDYGVERLPSYFGLFKARLLDSMLIIAANGALLAGVFMLAFEYVDSWGWIVMLPVAIWMLFILS